jgi:proline iminopeptidase
LRLDGRPFDTAGQRPRFCSDSSWEFVLNGLAGSRTRLLVSGYASSHPRALTAIGDFLFWEPAHWVMQTRQLTSLKRRAECPSAPTNDEHEATGVTTPAAMV